MDPMDQPERTYADHEPRPGFFCKVVGGLHRGRYGVLTAIEGTKAIVRTRDDRNQDITVNYSDVRPDVAGRR